MQFYISVMLLGLPDGIHEEKPSVLQFKKGTDRPSYRDARTHLEMKVFLHVCHRGGPGASQKCRIASQQEGMSVGPSVYLQIKWKK